MNILVIVSDPNYCHGMNRIIQRMGHNAMAMGTLTHGLKAARTHQVDAVIINARRSEEEGPAVLPEFSTLPSHPEIIITDSLNQNGAELSMTSGAWDYIEKGASVAHIALAIKRGIEYRSGWLAPRFSSTF